MPNHEKSTFLFLKGHSHTHICALEASLALQTSQSCHQAVSLRCAHLQCLLMEAMVILLVVRMGAKYLLQCEQQNSIHSYTSHVLLFVMILSP